ncbi:MAG: hypothetical protein LBF02_02565 [Mycoplasmataceae bacterium]|nr:hypothetical protein [Mycoplasmataceae bacterium]
MILTKTKNLKFNAIINFAFYGFCIYTVLVFTFSSQLFGAKALSSGTWLGISILSTALALGFLFLIGFKGFKNKDTLTILSFVFLILIVIIEGLFIFHNIAYIINDNQPIIIFDDILYTIWFLVFASSILITIVQTFYISSFIRTRLASVDKSSNDNQTILA